jgi:hypothetical protein
MVLALGLFSVASTSMGQWNYTPPSLPKPMTYDFKIPQYTPQYNVRVNPAYLQMGENAEKIGTVWFIISGIAAVVFIVGIALAFFAKTKGTNNPEKLAMADPWMRAKIEAMTPEERAAFFGKTP